MVNIFFEKNYDDIIEMTVIEKKCHLVLSEVTIENSTISKKSSTQRVNENCTIYQVDLKTMNSF